MEELKDWPFRYRLCLVIIMLLVGASLVSIVDKVCHDDDVKIENVK